MQNVLVTGGAGYVGSACCERLLLQKHRVVVVDDLSTGSIEGVLPACTFYREDIGNRAAMVQILKTENITTVFHFAAKALIPESVTNPGLFFDNNVARSINLLEAMRESAVSRFVFSSTAAVYGNPSSESINEEHPKSPLNSYGESKLILEQILQWYARAYKWSVVAFRYFNASGATTLVGEAHEPETHIIPLLLKVATGEREFFEIMGTDYATPDGTCVRDYVHVRDIAQAHLAALTIDAPGRFRAYNIGTGNSYSVRQVCDVVQQVVGRTLKIVEGKRRSGDPAILRADPTRLKTELGWKPQQSEIGQIVSSAWRFLNKTLKHSPRLIGKSEQTICSND